MNRERGSRAERARPETVKGEDEPKITPPKKTTKAKDFQKPLRRWIR